MSRSMRRQRLKSAKTRRPIGAATRRSIGLGETLEPRQLLAVVTWTGAGDGRLWNDAANWDRGVVPAHGDEVTIPDVAKTTEVIFPANNATLRLEKLVVDEWFRLQGGVELSGAGPYQFTSLNVEPGARLDGTAKVLVGGDRSTSGFVWSGGTIAGTGSLLVDLQASNAPGSITGGTLARSLSMTGAIDLNGTLFFGENGRRSTGELQVERGGVLRWIGGAGLQRSSLSGSSDHRLEVSVGGTFRKLTPSRFLVQRGVDLVNAGTMELNVGPWTLDGNFTQTIAGQMVVTLEGPVLPDISHHSQLQVTGVATLAGSIQVRTTNPESLVTGETVSFLTMVGNESEKRGVFDAWWGRRLDDGRWLRPVATAEGVTVRVDAVAREADAFEPNNSSKQAFDLRDQDFHQAALSLDRLFDEDWFQWTAPARGVLSIAVQAANPKSDVDVSVMHLDGHEVRESSTIGGQEEVTLPVLAGETYLIRIYHHDQRSAVTDYGLSVEWHPGKPRVYVAIDRAIHVFTEDGQPLPAETIRHPLLNEGRLSDVELDAQGTIYVGLDLGLPGGADGRILAFSPRGEWIRSVPLPADTTQRRLAYPAGFDVLADGTFLVTQPNLGRIVRVDAEGKTLAVPLDRPEDIPVDVAVLSNGELRWTNRRDVSSPFAINTTEQDLVWRAEEAKSEAVLLRGEQVVARVPSLFPTIEAQSSTDHHLYLLGGTANGDEGALERFDSAGRRISVTRLSGPIGGMAVSRGERPGNTADVITDRDADGLPDAWEEKGVDINLDGVIDLDLPAMGANPDRKDLFVEVDAMLGRAPALLAVSPQAVVQRGLATGTILDEVIEAFLNSPVNNPDGSTGIDLHIVVDETKLPLPAEGWKGWDEFDLTKRQFFGTAADRAAPNATASRQARNEVFRYAVFADRQAGSTSSGMAELPGNDFAVTLGAWPVPGGTARQQAGTFMHELGHTLGLREGGGDDIEYKPNYLSVMNYHWQVPTGNVGWRLDYSHEELPTLDENDLDERSGIGISRRDPDTPRRLAIQVGPPPAQHVSLIGAINWSRDDYDGDGVLANDKHVAADLNRVFDDQNGDGLVNADDATPGELLRGHNDWANLRFVFRDLHDTSSGRSLHFDGDDSTDLVAEDTERLNDDIFGGNDSAEDAADLGNGDWDDLDLTLPIDILNDWFLWTAGLAGKVVITMTVVDSTQPIDLVLRDSTQTELARQTANNSSVTIELPVNAGQVLYLQVTRTGADVTAHYTLSIDGPDFGDGPVFWTGAGNGVAWNDPNNWLIQGVSPGIPTDESPGDDLIWSESVDEALVELAGEPIVRSLQFLSDVEVAGAALFVESGKVDVGADCEAIIEADLWGNDLTKTGPGTLTIVGDSGSWVIDDGLLQGTGSLEQAHVQAEGALATASGSDPWVIWSDLIIDGQLLGVVSDQWEPLQVWGTVQWGAQSRLQLAAQTPLSTLGLNRRVLVQSGEGFVGTWQEMPPAGSSLGYGVFLNDVAIEPFDSQFAIVADLFQAFAGDANGDEHFDSADLVSIFQAGHFEQAGEAPIDWSEGDWDGDGQFTTSDLVVAFQEGRYES